MRVRDRERYLCERDVYVCVIFSPLTEGGLWRSNKAWHEEQIRDTERWRQTDRDGDRDGDRQSVEVIHILARRTIIVLSLMCGSNTSQTT